MYTHMEHAANIEELYSDAVSSECRRQEQVEHHERGPVEDCGSGKRLQAPEWF